MARDSNRNREVLEDVEEADPAHDLVSLMNQTSRFELPQIRERALVKVHAHPDLNTALADAVRDAIVGMADDIREPMRSTHSLRSDAFEPELRRILGVADKYQVRGGRYVDTVRQVRAALDEPRESWQAVVQLAARRTLDQWLQAQGADQVRVCCGKTVYTSVHDESQRRRVAPVAHRPGPVRGRDPKRLAAPAVASRLKLMQAWTTICSTGPICCCAGCM